MRTRATALAPALACALAVAGAACSGKGGGPGAAAGGNANANANTGAEPNANGNANGDVGGGSPAPPSAGGAPGWVTVAVEDFEHGGVGDPAWQPDPVPDDGPYADHGAYFTALGVVPPAAWRISQPFGSGGWLTAESYTLDAGTPFSTLASVVADPADASNHALRIRSPARTDATVVRPSAPLPERYRVSLRMGFASFGDGLPGPNGYGPADAAATAGPWSPDVPVRTQNGFYWLTILDSVPRPHNNTWIHHHRKVVIDSDNNDPPWTYVWDGSTFALSGEHPINMFAIDGRGPDDARSGRRFIPFSAGAWQPSGTVRSVDAYLPGQWYRVSIERSGTQFTLEISGTFRYGGATTYRATIDAAASCVYHFNRSAAEDASACVDPTPLPGLGPDFPEWPAGTTWPDWFMLGDPHENFYAGEVYVDDVKLEAWRP